jgi:membrane fusion protein (multidrug efflux system)
LKKIFSKKILLILTAIIVLLVIVKVVTKEEHAKLTKSDVSLLNQADITTVKQESISAIVNFTGDLSPKAQTIISSEVDAKILKVMVEEGQLVKAGQALAELDTLDLAQAVSQQEAQVAAAKAKLELDKQKMDKQEQLLKQGFISQIAFDELINNYQASLQNYKAQLAMLTRSKKQLANTHITAPFAGVIYQKSIEPGQLALKNTKLFALANLDTMEIKAAIPSDQINAVSLGQSVVFKVETDTHEYLGTVARINQVAVAGTRSYTVYIEFNNKNSVLKAGQFIKGQIVLKSLPAQLIVSCDALRSVANDQYVLVLKDGVVVQKPVKLILENQQNLKCAVSGLATGEKVLAGNVLTVKAGDKVRVVD